MNPTATGDLSASKVLAALLASGRKVLIPWGDGQRYDMVVDNGDSFERIQVKTGHLEGSVIKFNTFSVDRRGRRNYDGEIETFGVYCPENDSVYLVPISVATARCRVHLRVIPTKNGQSSKILFAADYVTARHPVVAQSG